MGTTGFITLQVSNTVTSKTVFGLLEGTTYEWAIRIACNPLLTNVSGFTDLIPFTTPSANRSGNFNSGILLYPNPASSRLTVSTASAYQNIRIFDAKGRLLEPDIHFISKRRFLIAVDGLGAGVYLLRLDGDSGFVYHRFVVGR